MHSHNPTDRLVVYCGVIIKFSAIQWHLNSGEDVQDADKTDIIKWLKQQKKSNRKKGRWL